jgi:peptidoglycan/LPS O-acetylase OafA/YrhL
MGKDKSADGLRGIAAANVVLCHLLISLFPLGYRYLWPSATATGAPSGMAERIISAPFLSILWNGNFPVCVFFVLSGYVLSARFSRNGDLSQLTTMALRRYFRLGVPVLGSVLFAYAVLRLGIASNIRIGEMTGSAWLAHFWQFDPTFSAALANGLYGAMFAGSSEFVPVLWTMRVELLGSFLVFGYAALAPRGRLAPFFFVVIVVAIASIDPAMWPLYMAFLLGVHIGRAESRNRMAIALSVFGALLFGAYDGSSIYGWTSFISDDFVWRKHFFNVLGGACAVYAVRGGFAQGLLTSRPVQFLGRISYALYLVHFPLVLTILCGLYGNRVASGWSRGPSAVLAIVTTFAMACFVAALFQRTFDVWGIRLSHRLFPGKPPAKIAAASESQPLSFRPHLDSE